MITQAWLIPPWAMLWIVLLRALLVRANLLPATCKHCGRRLERHGLGEEICSC
jgi:hypothetical protein